MQGAFDSAGKQTVCDGYRAIRLNTPIDLPAPPVPCTLDIDSIFAAARNNTAIHLETPTQAELKSHIKIAKAENKTKHGKDAKFHRPLWDFGEGRPAVNAVFLLDILTAFPDAVITFSKLNAPLYFAHADGEAILSPVRNMEVEQ